VLITQRQAIKRLRAETRRRHEWCEAKAKELATECDGARMKIPEFRLTQLIESENDPKRISRPAGVRPISQRKATKIRSYA
jgi:hypothetical protein